MWRLTGLALVQHALGDRAASDAALEELRKEDPVGIAYQFAEIHAYRGEIRPRVRMARTCRGDE